MDLRSFDKKAKMELVDRGFSQKIVDKYTNLKLFTANFAPIISTRRVIPHKRWLELVYAMPYLVLRREILNSFKRTKNVFASAKRLLNFFIHLDFPRSPYEYITTRLDRFSREIMNIQYLISNIQANPVSGILYPVSSSYVNHVKSRGFYFKSYSIAEPISHENSRIETGKESAIANYQLQLVSPKPSTVSNNNLGTNIPHSTSDFITPPFRYHSLGKEVRQRIHTYFKSYSIAEPISHENSRIETGKESAIANYQLQLVSPKPSTVSNNNLGTNIPHSTSDFITPPFRYHSLGKEVRQRIHTYFKSYSIAEPISHENSRIETGKESAIANYQLQLVSPKPSTVSNNNLGAHIPHSTSDLINISSFNFINNKNEQKQLGIEKAPIYHTYPKIEHVTSTHTELIKEKVIEKEDKPLQATPPLPSIDLNSITDQVYQLLERKIRIERERRGLLCR